MVFTSSSGTCIYNQMTGFQKTQVYSLVYIQPTPEQIGAGIPKHTSEGPEVVYSKQLWVQAVIGQIIFILFLCNGRQSPCVEILEQLRVDLVNRKFAETPPHRVPPHQMTFLREIFVLFPGEFGVAFSMLHQKCVQTP